ncbi:hypothetical protein SAY86_024326 [Trapa natans]|uniref:Uncharacterized protein n=1 Tax=Trapa natans TaxID=22666 RepID=A0AAN7RHW5_TRANT|nr:hypothetical protein SAY86_024326 [Trapa natans]
MRYSGQYQGTVRGYSFPGLLLWEEIRMRSRPQNLVEKQPFSQKKIRKEEERQRRSVGHQGKADAKASCDSVPCDPRIGPSISRLIKSISAMIPDLARTPTTWWMDDIRDGEMKQSNSPETQNRRRRRRTQNRNRDPQRTSISCPVFHPLNSETKSRREITHPGHGDLYHIHTTLRIAAP